MTKKLHDPFFKKALENPLVAREFFDSYLPDNIKKLINLETLTMDKESFVDPNLKRSMSDVLFTANFGNTQGYLYLLAEHQSTLDPLMSFRLFKYMLAICDRHLTINPDAKKLPLVYPILFYNAKQNCTASKNLWDLFEDSSLAKNIWAGDHQLVNVHDIPDAELKEKLWAGTMSFFMKHIHERDLAKKWQEIADNLPKITEVSIGYDFIEILLSYTLPNIEKEDKILLQDTLNKKLGKEKGEHLMTSLAQHWYDEGKLEGVAEGISKGKLEGVAEGKLEGVAEGIIKGKIEIAKNLLSQNMDINTISAVTNLSVDQIQKLKS